MVWWFVYFAGGTACASRTGGFPYIWNAEAHPGIQPLTCEEQEPIAHKDVETSGLCRSVGFFSETKYSAIPVDKVLFYMCFLFVKGEVKRKESV